MTSELTATYVVVGGGIAGVTCIETLAILDQNESAVLITASSLVKQVTNVMFFSKTVTKFDINEAEAITLQKVHSNLNILYDSLKYVNSKEKYIQTDNGVKVNYKYLCICTGGIPKMIADPTLSDRIIAIRDTDSVSKFVDKIKTSKKMTVIGNGGIASEIIYNTKGIDKVWIVKDSYISSTFIDPGAAEFFQSALHRSKCDEKPKTVIKRLQYQEENCVVIPNKSGTIRSAALGPDWVGNFADALATNDVKTLKIMYDSEIDRISFDESKELPLCVKLKNGDLIESDLIVSAIGVEPAINFEVDKELILGTDGGILVDEYFRTNLIDVYAAGDACTAGWDISKHWFQMRLWTQARQMGASAAKAMHSARTDEPTYPDFCYELFTHCTNLYGYQVVLLGAYNGQHLNGQYDILLRVTKDLEYVKLVMKDGRLYGAILVGQTDLEEMCENLILNGIDLTDFGEDILDPNVDIDDYFD